MSFSGSLLLFSPGRGKRRQANTEFLWNASNFCFRGFSLPTRNSEKRRMLRSLRIVEFLFPRIFVLQDASRLYKR